MKETSLEPAELNNFLEQKHSSQITEKQRVEKVLLRPDIELNELISSFPVLAEKLNCFNKETLEQASIQIKYEVYIEKEKELVSRMSTLENLEIPSPLILKRFLPWEMKHEKNLVVFNQQRLVRRAVFQELIRVMCKY